MKTHWLQSNLIDWLKGHFTSDTPHIFSWEHPDVSGFPILSRFHPSSPDCWWAYFLTMHPSQALMHHGRPVRPVRPVRLEASSCRNFVLLNYELFGWFSIQLKTERPINPHIVLLRFTSSYVYQRCICMYWGQLIVHQNPHLRWK